MIEQNEPTDTFKALLVAEQGALDRCEAVISRGLQTYIEVGSALLEIRDQRLYRATHQTFADYCNERWHMSRQRAYQLIDASEISAGLSTIVDISNVPESHIRPLVGLAPDQQVAAYQAAHTQSNGRPTARDVQTAVDQAQGTTPDDLRKASVQLTKHGSWFKATGYSGVMNGWSSDRAEPWDLAVHAAREEIERRTKEAPPAAPDLADILLRLDAHGYAKTTTREKGSATLYSFRDYSGRHDETGGEVELAEGELPFWLAELDSAAAYAQAKQERFIDARDRSERLGYDLRRDGDRFVLTPSGQKVPALVGTLDQLTKTIEGYEKNAAKNAAASESKAHQAKEAADRDLLSTAQANIAIGNIGDARTLLSQVSEHSAYARDQLLSTIPPLPTDAPIALNPITGWWNCGRERRAMEAAVNHSDRAGALHAALDLVRLFAGDDPKRRAAALLIAIGREMKGITTDDQEGLSQAISDLNECQEGTEVKHWIAVGYALLDLEATE